MTGDTLCRHIWQVVLCSSAIDVHPFNFSNHFLIFLLGCQVELLEMVTSGIVAFFSAQPAMLDQVPQLGHIPKLFKAMSSRNDAIPKTALQIVQQLSNSEVCV